MPRLKTIHIVVIIVILVFAVGVGSYTYSIYSVKRCAACGVEITSEMDEHFVVVDGEGNRIHVCSIICAFRLLDPAKGWDELHIDTFCDYYGPDYKIRIDAYDHGKKITFTPNTTRIIMGGKARQVELTRVAYNETAAKGLLEEGYSEHTMSYQQCSVTEGSLSAEPPTVAPPNKIGAKIPTKLGLAAQWPVVVSVIIVVGVAILVLVLVAYKKLFKLGSSSKGLVYGNLSSIFEVNMK
jgi:hypothetical protein